MYNLISNYIIKIFGSIIKQYNMSKQIISSIVNCYQIKIQLQNKSFSGLNIDNIKFMAIIRFKIRNPRLILIIIPSIIMYI